MTVIEILQYAFIQRAFVAGTFVAILCAILGLFLVLRKMSLIGDGLSHVSFGAIALGLFLGIYPFHIAIPVAILGAYFILKVSEKAKVYGDAAIAIISAVGVSTGVLLASKSSGFNIDLFSYLFGNILAISPLEVYLSIGLSIIVLLIIWRLYRQLFAATFDEEYARATGINTGRLSLILSALTAVTVVLTVRVVGVMLVSALLVIPAVTALQLARGFKRALIYSSLVAVASVWLGIIISFFANLPAGATIVMVSFVLFLASMLFKRI